MYSRFFKLKKVRIFFLRIFWKLSEITLLCWSIFGFSQLRKPNDCIFCRKMTAVPIFSIYDVHKRIETSCQLFLKKILALGSEWNLKSKFAWCVLPSVCYGACSLHGVRGGGRGARPLGDGPPQPLPAFGSIFLAHFRPTPQGWVRLLVCSNSCISVLRCSMTVIVTIQCL